MDRLETKTGLYEIGAIVASNDQHKLRLCANSENQECLLQIATDRTTNDVVARNAWFLKRLSEEASQIEEKSEKPINYALAFPNLIESMTLSAEQGERLVNILRFNNVESIGSLIPLVKIWKDSLRVDLRTSAWIMGKLLKVISFAHDCRIEVKEINGNNILIDPDQHYVIVFDWSRSVFHEDAIPASIVRDEIKKAAILVIKAIGGDLKAACETAADLPYIRFLELLSMHGANDARIAHQQFYEVVDSLCSHPESTWKTGHFHKFTALRSPARG